MRRASWCAWKRLLRAGELRGEITKAKAGGIALDAAGFEMLELSRRQD